MKFLTSILGSERDRAAKKRRSLEVSLHRLEEKAFLLEMELEETKREREKVLKELRSTIPVRHISTVSATSCDFSFNTDSTNVTERYCGLPIDSSTPKEEKIRTISGKPSKQNLKSKANMYAEEEKERSKWLGEQHKKKQQNGEACVEKY
ncbi:unnamed protein product [Caenorhabditis sp. 36 PRJEB53466]|nr:unnamed protein product [Caenorhabditis sp. 36 PRJEB53466]